MMGYQKNLPSLVIFLILLLSLLAYVKGQIYCFNNGSYTNNNTYHNNLNTLLSTMSTNIADNGFYNASLGQNSNRVNAYAFCLGDIQLDTCRSCIRNATDLLLQSCLSYKHALIWSDPCMVRYSNASLFGILEASDFHVITNMGNYLVPNQFMSDFPTLLNDVRSRASNGGTLRKVATGNRSTAGFQTIYAMLQCTPDLSQQNCESCLISSAQQLPRCCVSSPGAQIISGNCYLRYDTYPFYNETRLQEFDALVHSPIKDDNNSNNSTPRTTTIIIVSVVAGLMLVVLSGFYIMKMKPKGATKDELAPSLLEGNATDEISIFESLQYDFGIFKAATNDFSEANKLGQGGFGAVYKGKLPNGQEIAVKRLSIGSHQGDLEFKNEVILLVKLQHRNLVRLLGYSREGSEKLLVYELVQNASLDAFIFDATKRSLLDWDRRYNIIGGIARGILYLHEDSRLTIIHRDLKAGNVLLDGSMNPKIADFGMARLFVPNEIQGSTNRIVGTYGYMAPEYAMRGEFSVKSDVFSFGVLLLEIISGQKNNCFRHREIKADLISRAWKDWRQGTAVSMVDPVLNVGSSVPREILKCIQIGLLCVQENAIDRPTIASVIMMLDSFSITLPLPSHPAFFVYNRYDWESLPLREFNKGEENPNRPSNNNGSTKSMSRNDITISEFQAR